MRDSLVRLLTELVETPSVNPLFAGPKSGPGGESEIVHRIEARLRDLGLETWIVEAAEPGRPSVVGRWRGAGEGRSLMLNGHIDTVGVEEYDEAFVARIDGDRLYGRGSYDMKGGVATCIAALERLAREERSLAGDVWISAVADEEAASLGARAVAERFPTDGVVVTEPTELAPIVAHKGFLWLEVKTTGFACHGSDHERGVDANRRMAPVFRALDRLEEERSRLRHDLLGPPSLHVGRLEGGFGPSVYSPSCVATIELRTLPGEETAALVERLRELIEDEWPGKEPPGVELSLERQYLETGLEGALFQALTGALRKTGIDDLTPRGVAYWTDAAIFARHSGEALLFGPAGDGAHQNEEWVDVPSVVQTAEALYELALDYCGDR